MLACHLRCTAEDASSLQKVSCFKHTHTVCYSVLICAPPLPYVAKIVVPEGTRDIPLGKVGVSGGGVSRKMVLVKRAVINYLRMY